jgi:C-terminal processing protease CtpA/Prc
MAAGGEWGIAQPTAILNENPTTAYLSSTRSAQGYLGVDIRDIDSERAAKLKLKDAHGAEIVTVDHDAPANKAGLKVHDVVLEMNGQRVEGAEQFRRMLKEISSGHTVDFLVSRDGQEKNLSVELADRAEVEAKAWKQHFTVPDPSEGGTSQGFLAPSHLFGNGFFGVFTPSSLYIGADVDAISTQLAGYFGVSDGTGLLVKSVDENSPAATAGLKAGDIITKVNNDTMTSRSDWLKAMHSNRGKQVQLTVMRNRKEQLLNMQAGEPKKKGEMELPAFSPDDFEDIGPDVATLDTGKLQREIQDAMKDFDAAALTRQADELAKDIDAQKLSAEVQKELGSIDFQKMQRQMEELRKSLDSLDFIPLN